jgi:eukaryotic-like serine/threonine-protein kinase
MTGKTISHYQIAEKLGEGGMGVVYKARDTSLDRYVALKLLPADKLASPERKQRFIQEAKAASALNHPHIVTIHEIAEEDGHDFIVMEYVAGKTLDALIRRNGMRLGEALKYAVQIADALAAAHAAGIIHRDIKPSNIIVGDDGRVRVLDFGLAKLAERTTHASPEAATVTAAQIGPVTGEGTILGTPNYMSPEQAQGLPIDARSDIFSFGAVLYEMLTGRRAFQGDTAIAAIAAIVERDPTPLLKETPPDLIKLITRCLRKDPDRRLSDIKDVRLALEDVGQETSAPQAKPFRRFGVLTASVVVLVAIAGLLGFYWSGNHKSNVSLEPVVPLTTSPGLESFPSFSPDGNKIAFARIGEGLRNWDIYVKQIDQSGQLQLTSGPALDTGPVWSPDGKRIAFFRKLEDRGEVVVVPSIGGPETVLVGSAAAQDSGVGRRPNAHRRMIAWHPDGKHLVHAQRQDRGSPLRLWLIDVETREQRPLTQPSAGIRGDVDPAISPDGRRLVFRRELGSWQSAVLMLELNDSLNAVGGPRNVSGGGLAFSPAWTPDGREIVFAAGSEERPRLWRVAVDGGEPQRIIHPAEGTYPALSPRGDRVAFTLLPLQFDIWQADLPDGSGARPLIASSYPDVLPKYSPDGSRIAFSSTRTGCREIWVCNADGSDPQQLTFLESVVSSAPFWSPEGTRIVFQSVVGSARQILVVGATGGTPVPVTEGNAINREPTWSRDGEYIYFASNRSGEFKIWKVSANGGEAQLVSDYPATIAVESHDGQTLYMVEDGRLYSMPAQGGKLTKLVDGGWSLASLALTNGGIYTLRGNRRWVKRFDFRTRQVHEVFETPIPAYLGLSVSPDGKTILFTQGIPRESDILLAGEFY